MDDTMKNELVEGLAEKNSWHLLKTMPIIGSQSMKIYDELENSEHNFILTAEQSLFDEFSGDSNITGLYRAQKKLMQNQKSKKKTKKEIENDQILDEIGNEDE